MLFQHPKWIIEPIYVEMCSILLYIITTFSMWFTVIIINRFWPITARALSSVIVWIVFGAVPSSEKPLGIELSCWCQHTAESDVFFLFEPFKPQYPHAYSPHCSPYISYVTSWENFLKNQHISYLVIISFILKTCMFDQVVIL